MVDVPRRAMPSKWFLHGNMDTPAPRGEGFRLVWFLELVVFPSRQTRPEFRLDTYAGLSYVVHVSNVNSSVTFGNIAW